MAEKSAPRKVAKPRRQQDRPTVSFRLDQSKLGALDKNARRLRCTRTDLIEAVINRFLGEPFTNVAELDRYLKGEKPDDRQLNIFG